MFAFYPIEIQLTETVFLGSARNNSGLVGEPLGELILNALKEQVILKIKIVLLNDQFSTLLGGKAAYDDRNFDSIGLFRYRYQHLLYEEAKILKTE